MESEKVKTEREKEKDLNNRKISQSHIEFNQKTGFRNGLCNSTRNIYITCIICMFVPFLANYYKIRPTEAKHTHTPCYSLTHGK